MWCPAHNVLEMDGRRTFKILAFTPGLFISNFSFISIYSGTPSVRPPLRQKQLAVLTRMFYKKIYGGFCQAAKKSGRNNEVAVRRGSTVPNFIFSMLRLCISQCVISHHVEGSRYFARVKSSNRFWDKFSVSVDLKRLTSVLGYSPLCNVSL